MYLSVILYLVSFFRTLLIIVIFFIIIRLVARFVLPLIVQKGVKNMQQKMDNQYRSQQTQTRPEGKVTIEKNRKNSSDNNSYEGEYVDFEEVD